MYKSTVEHAAVLGSGMMGPGIALTLAIGGVPATIVSRTPEGAHQGLAKARAQAGFLAAHDLLSAATAAAATGRLSASADFDAALSRVDLVIESTPEQMGFKQELFARLEASCPAHAILASNTSGLSITSIASRCTRPERVVTTHFWNPPHLMPLVEIVRGERTAPGTVEALRTLLTACGKTAVVVKKDRPGQLGNRLQMALLREAVNIIAEGIAEAGDVDAVLKSGIGIRMPAYGTLEHMDLVGLDMCTAIIDYVTRDLNNDAGAPPFMRTLVERGNLGAKSGLGFYDWSQKSAEEVKANRDAFLVEVLRYRRGRAAGA